jgi:threonine dehydratase
VLVSDAAVARRSAVWEEARIALEPGGATALAALLSGAWVPPEGAKVGILLCGANVDPSSLTA